MKSFFDVKTIYDDIKKKNSTGNYHVLEYEMAEDKLDVNMVITCVFSAMAIEAYINDYIASRIGDSEFYDNYDKLSIESKFHFAAKFIMKSVVRKDNEYYSLFKKLFKNRNNFVHSKSKSFDIEKLEKYNKNLDVVDTEGVVSVNIESLDEKYETSRDAVKAILKIADYFEDNDKNASARFLLDCDFEKWAEQHGEEAPDYIKFIYKEFKTK